MQTSDFEALVSSLISDPSLQPVKNSAGIVAETFCNVGFAKIALTGWNLNYYQNNEPLTADQLIAAIQSNPSQWEASNPYLAWDWSMKGNLAIACITKLPHGHIACVYPKQLMPAADSSHFANIPEYANGIPYLANIGEQNGILSENYVFTALPMHYRYIGGQ